MDNVNYTYQIVYDPIPHRDLGESTLPRASTFFLSFELYSRILPETTLQEHPIEQQAWEIPHKDLSLDLIGYIVACRRLPVTVSVSLATQLYLNAQVLPGVPLSSPNEAHSFRVLITATLSLGNYWAFIESISAVIEVEPKSASASAIAALEVVRLETDPAADSTCRVCFDDLPTALAVSLPCGHVYHKDCIVRWLERSHLCPLCRYAMPI